MMSEKLKIKVCGMKNPANREALESLPADLFGFIFYPPSPRYAGGLTGEELQKLTATQKEKAAVFVNAPTAEIIAIAKKYGFTHVQLHGGESPDTCRQIRDAGFQVIKVFHITPGFSFSSSEPYAGVADLFLFEKESDNWGGSGRKFDWHILDNYKDDTPFFLSGGIRPGDEEVIAGITHPAFYGIDLNSGFEDSPGQKNREKLRLFLENLGKTTKVTPGRTGG